MATRKEYIKATAPVHQWERLFNTKFYHFVDENPHAMSDRLTVRALSYSLPKNMSQHVDHVFNTVQAPPIINKKYHRKEKDAPFRSDFQPNLRRVKESLAEAEKITAATDKGNGAGEKDGVGSNNVVTVAFLNAYYGITSNTGSATLSQAVFETGGQSYSQSDLSLFQNYYGLPAQTAIDIGGFEISSCTTSTCGEGNLDIQYISGVAQVTASNYWYVSDATDPFVAWITTVATEANPPQVNSMSWGTIEQVNKVENARNMT